MFHRNESDDGEEFSGSENDDAFDEDMEALRRACMITGTDPNDLDNTEQLTSKVGTASSGGNAADAAIGCLSSDSEDDFQLVRNIQNRLALSDDLCEPLTLKALCAVPPVVSDDEEDDFETLRVIERRFLAYNLTDTTKSCTKDYLQTPNQVVSSTVASENETSDNFFVNRINASEGFQDSEEACNNHDLLRDNVEAQPSGSFEWQQLGAYKVSMLPHNRSNFPKPAQVLIDAIKKNRSYQKFIRSKLTQIESRIEENKKLKERVKILKDFQVSCRKITGRALSQKKDPRVQLISAQKSRNSNDSEVVDKKSSAIHYGPSENSHVSSYRMALTKYPLSLHRKKWSKTERENLGKGIRQQFQEKLLQVSMDQQSVSEGSSADIHGLDNIFASIKDYEVTPEMIREFLPKVNWNQLASMYVEGRSGGECEARWLNFEDPLINHNPWTVEEDKSLLFIIQEKGITNWFDIAVSLGTNRTPFQCLARYQRSLNACIMKREWTEDEDEQLRLAVEAFGESNWQSVASMLKGRTGTQCSNRWKKTLHPMRQRVGRWTPDEDKRLTVATMLFGSKNWKKIAQFVPGRTQVQCRERWVNSLDPSVNRGGWTEEEDLMLEAAIVEHGFSWSKVAGALNSRTDNQCWRRWKVLHPDEVPLLQAARKMQKAALVSNFVDREQERPALGPNDFMPLALTNSASELGNIKSTQKRERKSRRKPESRTEKDAASCKVQRKSKSQRPRKEMPVCSEEVLERTRDDEIETSNQHDILTKKIVKKNVNGGPNSTKKVSKRQSKTQYCAEQDERSIVLPPSESLEAETTCGDGGKTLCDKVAVSNSKRGVPESNLRSNICEQDGICCYEKFILPRNMDEIEVMLDHSMYLDSTLLTTFNIEEGDVPNQIDASTRKRPLKLPPKKKLHVKLGEERNDLSSAPHTPRIVDDEFENLSLERIHKALKQNNKRKRCNQSSGECQAVGGISCQEDGCKTSEPTSSSYFNHCLEASDGDGITLASFLRNKSKKRRLKVAESSVQSCSIPESLLPSISADQHSIEHQMPAHMQDGKAETYSNGGIFENVIGQHGVSSHLKNIQIVTYNDGPGSGDMLP